MSYFLQSNLKLSFPSISPVMIAMFYFALYASFSAFFSLTLWVLLQTTDEALPRSRNHIPTPGLTLRPSFNWGLSFDPNDSRTFLPYVQELHRFLEVYNDSNQRESNIHCQPGIYHRQPDFGELRNWPKRACRFERSSLGACTGLVEPTFGFGHHRPCLFVKLNRVSWDFVKGPGTLIHSIHFFPPSAIFDPMYFPYYGKMAHVNYTVPLVAVQLNINTTRKRRESTPTEVECHVIGLLENARDRSLGRVSFKVKLP
uniref:Sodium/potassium-transporting ATPase subunit beta n=1 Tax=Eptatretus burgeri TaxID=7764 RepID=A0A8C4N6Q3_EPTBU